MPGHSEIEGNYKVDELARSGTTVSLAAEREGVEATLVSYDSLLDGWAWGEYCKRWSAHSNCAAARSY